MTNHQHKNNGSVDHLYRHDIDGLRAVAVIAVILFHLGNFPNGFLGVDVFFVISGFLITGIIRREQIDGKFSLVNFYLRRVRRIIPLTLFVSAVALIIGIATMLPDDLENLAQSIVATNCFSNNILQAITTKNYWDVVNEYKPLMHTWSLGVEEQFYMAYPLLFVVFVAKRSTWLFATIAALAAVSLCLCFLQFAPHEKFYYVVFRFWELAAGGLAAFSLKSQVESHWGRLAAIGLLVALLFLTYPLPSNLGSLVVAVLLTLGILGTKGSSNRVSAYLLENPLLVGIGKISFSLYMWHQVVLAFTRYLWTQDLRLPQLLTFATVTTCLSIMSYYAVEQPFRNRKLIGTKALLSTMFLGVVATTAGSLYLYQRAGIIRDIPELGISRSNIERGIHSKYNHRIHSYDKDFASTPKTKVLVVGNSFARDWVNVLLESSFAEKIEISYYSQVPHFDAIASRIREADVIFYSTPEEESLSEIALPQQKLWAVGTKSFGDNNGVFYNYLGEDRHEQRTFMQKGQLELEQKLKTLWQDRYVSYVEKIIDDDFKVPVFTPSREFISQDCRHLTKAGAEFFAVQFEQELETIFQSSSSRQELPEVQ
jgi:peptidoglycan/LPS O-acetylase OafA/YrhL